MTDELFFRYWNAVEETAVADGLLPSVAVRLCLRLAVQDAYDAGAALCNDMAAIIASQTQQTPDRRQAEADRAQMALIAEWLEANAPALYHGEDGGFGDAILNAVRKRDDDLVRLSKGIEHADSTERQLRNQLIEMQSQLIRLDADNADLAAKLQNAHLSWRAAQADADRMALRIAQQPAEIHVNGNGNGAAPTEVDDWRFYLTDAEQEFLESVETGRRRFGSLERSTRLAIVQAFARHVGNGLPPTQAVFDAAKPAWMPGAGGIAAGFGVPWSQILDLDPMTVQR